MSTSKKKRRQKQKARSAALLIALVLAIGLLGYWTLSQPDRTDNPVLTAGNYAQAAEAVEPVSEQIQPTAAPTPTLIPTPTAAPTAASTAEPTPEPTPEPSQAAFRYLPVLKTADTTEKKIAITVDDCFQPANLQTIMKTVYQNGKGRLTIFPIGSNLKLEGMDKLLKAAVFELGYEIENHTYNHARIFRMSEAEMAEQIYKHNEALNALLGKNYHEHIFRCMGGDGLTDQRTHNYLDQLGYVAFAQWSISGSDADMSQIKQWLKPGTVYLFHTTDADTAKLQEFIPYAVSQGYQLVTLNELFGFPQNEITDYAPTEMQQPRAYEDDYATQKKGDYTYKTVQLQTVLNALGYLKLDEPPTGYYGDMTVAAVKAFQQDRGLTVTGEADAETQRLLLQ